MNIANQKLLITLIGIIMLGAGVAIVGWWMLAERSNPNQLAPSVQPAVSSTPSAEMNNVLGAGILISAQGPVDLIVTDPDGFTITPTTIVPSDLEFLRQIPGELYYSEMEKGLDGNPVVQVYSYRAKIGDYIIKIVINPDKVRNPSVTKRGVYWLTVSVGEQSLVLASSTPLMGIPQHGYGTRVHQDGSLVAVTPHPTSKFKMYTNTEFGFAFEYPEDWVVEEKTFGGYYSKFNVVVRPTFGWYSQFPVLVNIVLPEFAERSFKNLEKTTTEVTVDGVPSIKYQYVFEGSQETAIILPFGEYKIILGTDGRHEDIFNQILASFKFLK